MADLKTMTDEELKEEVHRLACSVSYYNAAEGNWSAETEARNAVKKEFWEAQAELESRGIKFENRGYLI